MKVITIARQVGSWGDYIGVEIAKKLNMRYMDREIILEAAQRAGIPESSFESLGERKGLIQRLMNAISKTSMVPSVPSQALRHSELYSMAAPDERMQSLMREGFTQTEAARHVLSMRFPEAHKGLEQIDIIKAIVLELAQEGNVVLAGSGSQVLLRDRDDVLHILIVAPMGERIKAIIEQEKVSWKVAEKRVKENDNARASYFRDHHKIDWLDTSLYDLIINTSKIPLQTASDTIVNVFRSMVEEKARS